jgi:hypothetical protein
VLDLLLCFAIKQAASPQSGHQPLSSRNLEISCRSQQKSILVASSPVASRATSVDATGQLLPTKSRSSVALERLFAYSSNV